MNNSFPLKQKEFSGWSTLAGAMLAYGCICGDVTYAYGVFLPSMNEAFGWPRSALSGPYTLFLITGGLLGPLVGWTIDRFGARKNVIFGNIFAALGLLGMSQVREIWQVYLFFGVMGGGLAWPFLNF
jgi:MFS family permease